MNYKRFEPNIIYLNTVDSTNNYAANLIKETNVVNGTTIVTKRQNSGRGQRGSSWHTEPNKNLILSSIIYPNLNISHVFYLNIAVSLAVIKVLQRNNLASAIKWPNDIYIGKKKVAGILIENQLQGNKVKTGIIGLGLNVNQLEFPSELNATSLQIESGKSFDLQVLTEQYLLELDFYIDLLMQSNFKLLLKLYYQNFFQFEDWCLYEDKDSSFQGKIIGIDEQGKLLIETPDKTKRYDLKEVQFKF